MKIFFGAKMKIFSPRFRYLEELNLYALFETIDCELLLLMSVCLQMSQCFELFFESIYSFLNLQLGGLKVGCVSFS